MAKWWEELPDLLQPHDQCNGTGLINGQPDLDCAGTGEIPVLKHSHTQTEFFVKYALSRIFAIESKLDTLDSQLNNLDTHLDVIEDKIDAL